MMNGRPADRGNPSPPNSIGPRSSNVSQMSTEGQRRKQSVMEDSLAQHYSVLRRFLAQTLREDALDGRQNRARAKLRRLSSVQFQELSTDVYDELLRRQSGESQLPGGPVSVPAYLLPKDNFHPKRNQARQKLSTLPSLRFKDLATDVFYELERRFPRFAAATANRRESSANGSMRAPSRAGTPSGMRPTNARQTSVGGQVLAGLGIPGMGSQDEYNRPAPKTSQSNTIVPNKSYLVEDDDDDSSEIYGSRRDTGMTSRSFATNEGDKKIIADYQNKVEDLQGKVEGLESKLRETEGVRMPDACSHGRC
jgi:hypothetical protein